jgi:hypothetical protein
MALRTIPQRSVLPDLVGQTGGAVIGSRPFIPVASLRCVRQDLKRQLADVMPRVFQVASSFRKRSYAEGLSRCPKLRGSTPK